MAVVGDLVVTSGIDGIFPKGFTIGTVDVVEKSGPSYKRITVKPAVDFSSLEDVLVVVTQTPIKQVEDEASAAEEGSDPGSGETTSSRGPLT